MSEAYVSLIRPIASDAEHGFISRRSYATNLSEMMAYGPTTIKKSQLEVVYTGFRGAFHIVDRRLVFFKLQSSCGASGPLFALLRSCLLTRRQRAVINGCASS